MLKDCHLRMDNFYKLILSALLLLCSTSTLVAESQWQELQDGLSLGKFETQEQSQVGDSVLTILKIDPKLWALDIITESETGDKKNKTAKQWAKSHDLVAVINAGMFALDYSKHIGYMQTARHTNSKHVNKYQSVAAFNPKSDSNAPEFQIFDLDEKDVSIKKILKQYDSVVQNLRLIKKPGQNRWSQQDKMWSEAALGEDKAGNVLFIFSRSPFTMHDLNNELLGLNINLVAAQHLEGGPEAQLYYNVNQHEAEMFGSFETSFFEKDSNGIAWPIPNVIGVRKK